MRTQAPEARQPSEQHHHQHQHLSVLLHLCISLTQPFSPCLSCLTLKTRQEIPSQGLKFRPEQLPTT